MARKIYRILLLALFLLPAFPAAAQLNGADTAPGSSCAGFPQGASRLTADADQDGQSITLICNGTTWEAAGPGPFPYVASCGAGDEGTIRYVSGGTPSCPGGGVAVGGSCWYYSANNESCTAVCGGLGESYDTATLTYAGSDGDNTACEAVLDALGVPSGSITNPGTTAGGCATYNGDRRRYTATTTENYAGFGVRRACACGNGPAGGEPVWEFCDGDDWGMLGGGDNLGDHNATATLNMDGNDIDDIGDILWTGATNITGTVSASLFGDQNNYFPSGLDEASVLRLSGSAPRAITGIAGGTPGRALELFNSGSNPITLVNNSFSSNASNRFILSNDITIEGGQGIRLWYDGFSSRWRAVGGTGGGGGFTIEDDLDMGGYNIDNAGSIQLADNDDDCTAGLLGAIRYNTGSKSFEICRDDGIGWEPIVGAGAGGACDSSQTYATPGTHSYIVPDDFETLTFSIWGGGGGGGGGGDSGNVGGSGGSSSIVSLGLSASGGIGGAPGGGSRLGGAGGTATGGDTNLNGMAGGNGEASEQGGTGGSAPASGGAGGAGGGCYSQGANGEAPGGGGGGGLSNCTYAAGGGGSGAYTTKTYNTSTLSPGTLISDIYVGAGGASGPGEVSAIRGGVGGNGRITITCSTAPGGGGGGSTALDDLSDVDTTGVTDGDVLMYSAGASGYVMGPVSGGGGGSLPVCADDEFLLRQGGSWICEPRFQGAFIYRDTTQSSIPQGAPTLVQVGANLEYQEGSGWWSAGTPHRLSVPANVKIVRVCGMVAHVNWHGEAAGLSITMNGVDSVAYQYAMASAGLSVCTAPLSVDTGDYFELYVQNAASSSSDRSIAYSHMSIEKIK